MPLACLSKPLVFRLNIAKRCPYIIKFPQFDTPSPKFRHSIDISFWVWHFLSQNSAERCSQKTLLPRISVQFRVKNTLITVPYFKHHNCNRFVKNSDEVLKITDKGQDKRKRLRKIHFLRDKLGAIGENVLILKIEACTPFKCGRKIVPFSQILEAGCKNTFNAVLTAQPKFFNTNKS